MENWQKKILNWKASLQGPIKDLCIPIGKDRLSNSGVIGPTYADILEVAIHLFH